MKMLEKATTGRQTFGDIILTHSGRLGAFAAMKDRAYTSGTDRYIFWGLRQNSDRAWCHSDTATVGRPYMRCYYSKG
jgi:hypothetical protein